MHRKLLGAFHNCISVIGSLGQEYSVYQILQNGNAISDIRKRAEYFMDQTNELFERDNYKGSLRLIDRAKPLYETIDDGEKIADISLLTGMVYICMGDYGACIERMDLYIQMVLSELKADNTGLSKYGSALKYKGAAYGYLNQYDEAEKFLQESLTVFNKTNETDELADVYRMLGMLKLDTNSLSEAETMFRSSAELYLKNEDVRKFSSVTALRTIVITMHSNIDIGLELADLCLPYLIKYNMNSELKLIACTRILADFGKCNFNAIGANVIEYNKYSKNQLDKYFADFIEMLDGYICDLTGDYQRAELHFKRVLAKYKRMKNTQELSPLYLTLSTVYLHQNKIDSAKMYLDQYTECTKMIPGSGESIDYLHCKSALAYHLSDYSDARANLSLAYSLREQKPRYEDVYTMIWLGRVEHKLQKLDRGLWLLFKALKYHVLIGLNLGMYDILEYLSYILFDREAFDISVQLIGLAQQLRENFGTPRMPIEQEEYNSMIAKMHLLIGDEAFEKSMQIGRQLSMKEVLTLLEKYTDL